MSADPPPDPDRTKSKRSRYEDDSTGSSSESDEEADDSQTQIDDLPGDRPSGGDDDSVSQNAEETAEEMEEQAREAVESGPDGTAAPTGTPGSQSASDARTQDSTDPLTNFEEADLKPETSSLQEISAVEASNFDAVDSLSSVPTDDLEEWFIDNSPFNSFDNFRSIEAEERISQLNSQRKANIVSGLLAQRPDSNVTYSDVVAIEDATTTGSTAHDVMQKLADEDGLDYAVPDKDILPEKVETVAEQLREPVAANMLASLNSIKLSERPVEMSNVSQGELALAHYNRDTREVHVSFINEGVDEDVVVHELSHAIHNSIGVTSGDVDSDWRSSSGRDWEADTQTFSDAGEFAEELRDGVQREFERVADRSEGNSDARLRDYQTANSSEFIAVSLDAFMTSRDRLRETQPEVELLYAEKLTETVSRESVDPSALSPGDRVIAEDPTGNTAANAEVVDVDGGTVTLSHHIFPDGVGSVPADQLDTLDRLSFQNYD